MVDTTASLVLSQSLVAFYIDHRECDELQSVVARPPRGEGLR
jgi:hypothetical protein